MGCEVSPKVLIGWDEGVVVGVGVVSVLVGIEKSSTTGASINLASAATHSKTKWSDLFLTKQKYCNSLAELSPIRYMAHLPLGHLLCWRHQRRQEYQTCACGRGCELEVSGL